MLHLTWTLLQSFLNHLAERLRAAALGLGISLLLFHFLQILYIIAELRSPIELTFGRCQNSFNLFGLLDFGGRRLSCCMLFSLALSLRLRRWLNAFLLARLDLLGAVDTLPLLLVYLFQIARTLPVVWSSTLCTLYSRYGPLLRNGRLIFLFLLSATHLVFRIVIHQ